MATDTLPAAPAGDIRDTRLAEAISERYLSYALSIIMSRSLPDVRDGLKPVHRRLLFAMRQLRLDPDQGFKKCARVVGDVIGKYHPHGDTAVYDALVRLAQGFAVRYPLIDGQGNFGNIDGDNAAAMRYTEARMTEIATLMMEGLDEDAVDFRETYDGEESEPAVMPAGFPNLLANGAAGIAVGMATNIPPHNADEICRALLHLIKFPKATVGKLVGFMPGPDFPTGGILAENRKTVEAAYKIGRGSFRIRAKWKTEKLGRGQFQIVVTEIPYQVQKARLVERIAELMDAKKLPFLEDVVDESTEDVRLVLVPKSRSVEPGLLMEQLFRQTDLETRFGLNMNVLDADKTPRVMNLREVLQAFLDHRHEVLERRTNHRLGRIAARLEVLEGYLAAYLNLDEVIRIIREKDDAKAELIRAFKLTDGQAGRHPQHASQELAQTGGDGDQGRAFGADRGARRARQTAQGSQTPLEGDLRPDRRYPQTLRRQDRARQAPHRNRRCAGGRRRTGRGADREGADHHPLLRQGLDQGRAGTFGRRRRGQIQGRRQGQVRAESRNHRQADRLRHRRTLLHHRLRQAAGRAGATASPCG